MKRGMAMTLRGAALSGLMLLLLAGPAPLSAQTPPADENGIVQDSPAPAETPAPAPRRRLARPQVQQTPAPVADADTSISEPQSFDQPAPETAPVSPEAAAPPAPPAVGRLQPGTPIPAAELEAFLDGVMRQAMGAEHIPGLTLSIVQNGQTVLKKGYGVAALEPRRPVDADATLFRIGSISKLFTWIAVMKEVERGHMRLDAPVNLYLPEALQVKDQGYIRQVLLRDLMSHSAGFEDRSLGRLFERDPGRVRPLATYLRQEKPRRVRAQGVASEYSNYGAALAGAAVSQVSGRGYEDLIEGDILRPLGLAHTTFREPYPAASALPAPMPQALAQQTAQGFRWDGAEYDARPFEFISQIAPAGSASSTAGDMARFMTLILGDGTLDGVAVYGPQTARAFRTTAMRAAPGIDGWASGFMQRRLPGGFDGFGHEGQTLSFRSNLVTVPALGLGVFVAANSDTSTALVERLPALIVERFYAPPPPPIPAGSPELAQARASYAGDYLTEKRRYGGLEQFVALLTNVVHVDVSRDGRLMVRSPDGSSVWTPTGEPGQFRSLDSWQTASFQLAQGVAQRWLPPGGTQTYQRVGWLWQARTLAALAAAALIAAAATLIGIATRDRLQFRQTPIQGGASALQTSTAVLWFVAMGGFAAWALRARVDAAYAFFYWPGPWVLIASACALVATVCSIGQAAMLPGIWRGGRRVDSWTAGRKLRFTATALIFLAFGVLLLMWGALEPWSF
jgi:CubicO group peptidase (beta-lactamase class C family)